MLEHDPSDKSVDVHDVVAASSANVSFDDRMIDDVINNGANEMVDDARRVASERLLLLGIVLLADLLIKEVDSMAASPTISFFLVFCVLGVLVWCSWCCVTKRWERWGRTLNFQRSAKVQYF